MQVAAEYRKETVCVEGYENEPIICLVKSEKESQVYSEARFGMIVFVAAIVLIELAAKFN